MPFDGENAPLDDSLLLRLWPGDSTADDGAPGGAYIIKVHGLAKFERFTNLIDVAVDTKEAYAALDVGKYVLGIFIGYERSYKPDEMFEFLTR